MAIFRTLLWREFRDFRTFLFAMLLLGPLFIAALQLPYPFASVEYISGGVLIPAILTIFAGVFGADLICRERKDGVAASFNQLPVPARTWYLAKLTVFLCAVLFVDVWLIGAEALKFLVLGKSTGLFLDASLNAIQWHVGALFYGLAALSVAPWVRGSLTSVLAVLLLFLVTPFALFGLLAAFDESYWVVDLLALLSMWPLGAWLFALAASICVAGYRSWRVRSGVRFHIAQRVKSYVLGGASILVLASGAAAGHQWFAERVVPFTSPLIQGSSFSPDGRYVAIQIRASLPMPGPILDLLQGPARERVEQRHREREQRESGVWVYDLETGARVSEIEGYSSSEWNSEGVFEVRRFTQREDSLEVRRFDLATDEFAGISRTEDVEPLLPRNALFKVRLISRPEGGFVLHAPGKGEGPEYSYSGARSLATYRYQNRCMYFVSAEGELTVLDLSNGLPGTARVIAAGLLGSRYYLRISGDLENVCASEIGGSEERFFNLVTGAEVIGIPADTGSRFFGWTFSMTGSERSVRLLVRKQPDDSYAHLAFFDGREVGLAVHSGSPVATRPGGGYLAFETTHRPWSCSLVLLDADGARIRVLDTFQPAGADWLQGL